MNKKAGKLIGALFAIALTCCAVGACGQSNAEKDPSGVGVQNEISAPSGFKLSSKGVLSWTKTAGATAYEITADGNTVTSDTNEQDLFELVSTAGSYTAEVKAVIGEAKGEAGKFEFTAVKLDAPTKPVASTDPKTHAVKLSWSKGGETTKSYVQQVNGGKWITNSSGEFELSATGEYVLVVKAKAYASGNTLYLESEASEASDPVTYTQGPVLRLSDKINYIEWATDGDYDSYNLWIDGEKVKENVQPDKDGVYSLIEGANGESAAITKTGEYDIQIEAVKGDTSAWSNYLTEVGTTNIGENELYSFDNRIAKFTVIKDGVSVSNEQFHGEQGYSLRLNVTKPEQLNFVKYTVEGSANDIDYRRLKKISYWVYVEPIANYDGETLPASCLPAFKWEKQWLKPERDENNVVTGNQATWRSCMFTASEAVPFGVWTKVTIDNIQGCYELVFLLSYNNTAVANNFVMYIDDICYEELYDDTQPEDAEYAVSYDGAAKYQGAWYGNNFTEIDLGAENANKTVLVSMEVCGNANAEIENGKLALFNTLLNNADADCLGNSYMWININTAAISSMNEWHEIVIKLKTNAEGKAYLTAGYPNGNMVGTYNIFIKNVTPITVDGTAMPEGEKKSDGYYQSIVGLKPETDLAAGTNVTVEMDIFVTGSYDQYSKIIAIDSAYTDNAVKDFVVIGMQDKFDANVGKWIHVSFAATVRAFDKIRFMGGFNEIDTSSYGNAVFICAGYFKSAESFNYKNVTIEEGTPMPTGEAKSDGYYQSIVGLKPETDLAAGTNVTVEMDIFVTGSYDQYSKIIAIDSVYEDNAVKDFVVIGMQDKFDANVGKWIHVSFAATVRAFDKIRFMGGFNEIDTSSYGNAVFICAGYFKSAESFNYKNVVIEAAMAMPAGTQKTTNPNGYYQSFAGLKTDLAAGTSVTVEMDIFITGTYDQYTDGIHWVDTVWTTDGGEVRASGVVLPNAQLKSGEWIHVSFEATVRNFAVLRLGTEYPVIDTSEYGNAVYICARNFKSSNSFTYKNVVITEKA